MSKNKLDWDLMLMENVSVEIAFEKLKKEMKKISFNSFEEVRNFLNELSKGRKTTFRKSKKVGDMYTGLIHLTCCNIWIKAYEDGKIESLTLDINFNEQFYKPEIGNVDFQTVKIMEIDYDSITGEKLLARVKEYVSNKKNIPEDNIRERDCFWKEPYDNNRTIYEYRNEKENKYMYSATSENVIIANRKLENAELNKLADECELFYFGNVYLNC